MSWSCRAVPWVALALAGCAVMTGNTATGRDAGRDAARSDANLATDDGGHDAAAADDAGSDGGEDAGSDAGQDAGSDAGHDGGRDAAVVTLPVIDGVVGATEWAAATSGTNATATIWTGDELHALHAIAIGGTLYLAIEGRIEGSNGMVVYVDGDPGGTHGVANLATLTDATGALDNAISAGFTVPATFRADIAWGTTLMTHLVTGADDTTGFRDVTATPANFSWITSGTQTACTAAACEASIPTSALGPGPAPRAIQLFARIVDSMGLTSPNQTLPMDDPTMPRVVSVVMSIHE